MSLGEYLNKNSADCINSIQLLSTQFAQNTMVATLRFTSDGILLSAILFFLFWTDPLALLVLTVLLASVVFFYDRIFKSKISGYGKTTACCQSSLVKGTNEAIQGLKEIRILGVEPFFFEKVRSSAYKYANYFAKTQVLSVAPRYILEFCLILFIVMMVFITLQSGAFLQSIVPTLSVFAVSSLRLIPAANSISNGISQMRFGRYATQVIYNDLSSVTESMDHDPNLHYNDREAFKSLELRDVSFRYPSSKVFTLKNVSLSITSGEIIGVMGSTGSGKTTLINVMLGLLESFDGNVLVNGENVSGNPSVIRKNVAYLPQQIFLTDDSLRNNIALGEKPSEISDKKIFEVLSKVRLSEFVNELPQGLDTLVGERGMRLSGGQCQRVALARSLYHERSLLVLDEATSALDVDTEKLIIDELKDLKGEKTIVMIAHRLSTLKYCDRIYRFNDDRSLTLINYDQLMSA
jgi:ABC-type bacteriocin/lantibiotic exporter with double-glycine peptidase domain